jgi:hypothetical protein
MDKADLLLLLVEMVTTQEQLEALAEKVVGVLEDRDHPGDAEFLAQLDAAAVLEWVRTTGTVVPPMSILTSFLEEFDI